VNAGRKLGSFTIFDLRNKGWGAVRCCICPSRTSIFTSSICISGLRALSPETVTGLSVVRLPESEPRYVTVADTPQISRKGRNSVFVFTVPAHVTVDRVVFAAGTQPAQFSRDVSIQVEAIQKAPATDAPQYSQTVTGSGKSAARA